MRDNFGQWVDEKDLEGRTIEVSTLVKIIDVVW